MASFENYKSTAQSLEGGYQKLENDRNGNYNSLDQLVGTNYGISAPIYEKWIGYPPSEQDMRNITKSLATKIFRDWYWDVIRASEIQSQAVAETLVDHGINAGPPTAVKIMQEILNRFFDKNLRVDGGAGPLTLQAINSVDPQRLFQEFSHARIADYRLKNNSNFWFSIWKNRVLTIAKKFGITLKKKVPTVGILTFLLLLGMVLYKRSKKKES